MTASLAPVSFDQFEAETLAMLKPAFRSRFGAISWRDIEGDGPKHEWLIKGLMTRGEMTMLAGPSQSGKSFLAIDLALCVATGRDWFGRRVRRGGVVYQAGESATGVRRKRIPAYMRKHNLSREDDVPFELLTAPVDLYSSDEGVALLIEEIRHWGSTFSVPLELVVIDTFSTATPGANENASEDMTKVLGRCERIKRETGAAVMLVHHMNAAGEKPRGHTSIFANLDSVLICKKQTRKENGQDVEIRDDDNRIKRELKIAKAKDSDADNTWRFVLQSIQLGVDEDGDPITSCAVLEANSADNGSSSGPDDEIKLSAQREIFVRAVSDALDKFGTLAPMSLDVPSTTRVVEWKHVRTAFSQLAFDGDEESDPIKRAAAIQKALKRHGEALLSRRIINRSGNFVWLTGRQIRGFRKVREAPLDQAPAASGGADYDEIFDGLEGF